MDSGAWLFRNRGWLPVPLLLGMLLTGPVLWGPGLLLVVLGEGFRLLAVGHIGGPSRTQGADVGPLVATGLYGRLRNPLYVGNILLFAGLGVVAWPWVFVAVPALSLHYHLIVAWEEKNLAEKLGDPYRAYLRLVPRWLPLGPGGAGRWDPQKALRSEKSTLLALLLILSAFSLRGALPFTVPVLNFP